MNVFVRSRSFFHLFQFQTCFCPFVFGSGELILQFAILGEEDGVAGTFGSGEFPFYFSQFFFQLGHLLFGCFHGFFCAFDKFVALFLLGIGEEGLGLAGQILV